MPSGCVPPPTGWPPTARSPPSSWTRTRCARSPAPCAHCATHCDGSRRRRPRTHALPPPHPTWPDRKRSAPSTASRRPGPNWSGPPTGTPHGPTEDPAPPPTTPSSSSPTRPSSSSPAPTATGCAPAWHPTACSSSSRTTHAVGQRWTSLATASPVRRAETYSSLILPRQLHQRVRMSQRDTRLNDVSVRPPGRLRAFEISTEDSKRAAAASSSDGRQKQAASRFTGRDRAVPARMGRGRRRSYGSVVRGPRVRGRDRRRCR
ncbi:hypothetical protein MBT84_43420 [Streptomyces sp. MBT84]|nr:hypothetical protein [Streptomyces sp. MBT84]